MADEAKTHKEELIAICVRYTEGLKIRESFLEFMNCPEARNAIGLYCKIKQSIAAHNLENIPIIAQSFDGASVMSGKYNGVQTLLQKDYPEAIYIHCMAHKFNLTLVNACRKNATADQYFSTLTALYSLCS